VAIGPVAPVLNDAINGNAERAVLRRDIQQLLLALIAFLALPVTPRPFAEHRRSARQRAVTRNCLVQLRAIAEVVIDRVARLRTPRHFSSSRLSHIDSRYCRVVP